MTVSVRQVLESKGSTTYCVAPGVTAYEALALMAEHNIGGVLVTESDRLVGIFTERDYARKVVLKGLRSTEVQVRELMTPTPTVVGPEQTIDEVMNIMSEGHFRHLPVIEDGRIVGVISIGDVVKSVIDQQRRTIDHLSNYIAGDITT
ncbi:CBS domain-containing protein [Pseudothauera nasutitermitis]|uniref:CBS domain-containing protein n=1 Tax=Pseudothauera nasutitermitis TaxID=2565930 RepID=A0A4S4AP95_9RHOO|nr:CBS domain-containing protein [Pseudothauera nasutitermitis]THF61488.1 CBS domain-containing protein [Pseudothauera nasutitermitis]